jgi:hypothetical protein
MWGAKRGFGLGVAVLCVLLRAYQTIYCRRGADAPPPHGQLGSGGGCCPPRALCKTHLFNLLNVDRVCAPSDEPLAMQGEPRAVRLLCTQPSLESQIR